jgi:hypothetical protein
VDTTNKIFINPDAFKKSNLAEGRIFFNGQIFPPDWLAGFAQSWQH